MITVTGTLYYTYCRVPGAPLDFDLAPIVLQNQFVALLLRPVQDFPTFDCAHRLHDVPRWLQGRLHQSMGLG
jgi:hypothetical protein